MVALPYIAVGAGVGAIFGIMVMLWKTRGIASFARYLLTTKDPEMMNEAFGMQGKRVAGAFFGGLLCALWGAAGTAIVVGVIAALH